MTVFSLLIDQFKKLSEALKRVFHQDFYSSLIIYDENTKEITTIKAVWMPSLNLQRFFFIPLFSVYLMIISKRS